MQNNNFRLTALAILITSIAFSYLSYILLSQDKNFNKLNSLLTIASALSTSIIGGYIAYYASYIQIKANKQNESYRLLQQYISQCVLTKHEIDYIIRLLKKCLERNVTFEELKKHLNFPAIEKLKNDHILLLDEKNIERFLSIYYKLSLIKIGEEQHFVPKDVLNSLIADCESMSLVISKYHDSLIKKNSSSVDDY